MYSAVILFFERGAWKSITPPPESGFQPIMPDVSMSFNTIREHILQISKYEDCSKFLGTDYIIEQLPKNNIYIVVYNQYKPIGYIMANFLPDNGVYLDVICATERKGAPLLNMFIHVCKINFSASYIKLSSLMHVLTYYPRLGFSHRASCAEPPTVAMTPELANYIVKKMQLGELNSDAAFFDDPKIARFISELHKYGYTKADTPPSCQDKSLGIGLQKQRSCAKDGYTMIKCLNEPVPPPATHIVPFANYVRTVAPRSTKPSRELQFLLESKGAHPLRSTRKSSKPAKSHKKSTGIASRSLRGSHGKPTTRSSVRGTQKKHPLPRAMTYRLKTIREE